MMNFESQSTPKRGHNLPPVSGEILSKKKKTPDFDRNQEKVEVTAEEVADDDIIGEENAEDSLEVLAEQALASKNKDNKAIAEVRALINNEDADFKRMEGEAYIAGAGDRIRKEALQDDKMEVARGADAIIKEEEIRSAKAENAPNRLAEKGLQDELAEIQGLKIQEFSGSRMKDLEAQRDELVEKINGTKGVMNFFKKRAMQKELNALMEEMTVNFDNYSQLRADRLRVDQDLKNPMEASVKKIYEAEAKKLDAELAPYEAIITRERDRENATRKGERNPGQEEANRAAKTGGRGSGGTSTGGGVGGGFRG